MGHSLSDAHAPPLNSGPISVVELLLQEKKIHAKSARKMDKKSLFIVRIIKCCFLITVG
jgi:hypothetical protein